MDPERAILWVVVGAGLPLLAVGATAFAKAAVLLGVLRGGLGVPSALPVAVTTALAAALALLVMAPVARRAVAAVGELPADTASDTASAWADAAARGWPVLEAFLVRQTRPEDAEAVASVTLRLDPTRDAAPDPPARIAGFLISELRAAFEAGVLLLLPFLVVDLLVASTLTVVGFGQLSPTWVALPFKLLLFVAADGWSLLLRGFVEAYA
jgi:type III secretion protein R